MLIANWLLCWTHFIPPDLTRIKVKGMNNDNENNNDNDNSDNDKNNHKSNWRL